MESDLYKKVLIRHAKTPVLVVRERHKSEKKLIQA